LFVFRQAIFYINSFNKKLKKMIFIVFSPKIVVIRAKEEKK